MKLNSILSFAIFAGTIAARKHVRIDKLTPEFRSVKSPMSTRVQVRFGPYELTPDQENEVSGFDWRQNVTKPCTSCVLKYVTAEIVYANLAGDNGKGVSLDNLVLSVEGEGRNDMACDTYDRGERILIVDSSRTDTTFGLSGADEYGIHIKKDDTLSLTAEMSNAASTTQTIYLQMTYEFQPGKPGDYKEIKTAWFDAEPCGSRPFSSPYSGKWIAMTLEQAAPDMWLLQNGMKVCESKVPDDETVKQFAAKGQTNLQKYMQCQLGSVNKGDRIATKVMGKRKASAAVAGAAMGLLVLD